MTAGLIAQFQNLLHAFAVAKGRNRHDDLPDTVSRNQLRNIFRRAADRNILDAEPLLARRIVDKNDWLTHLLGVFVADVNSICTCLACANDHDRHGVPQPAGNTILRTDAPEHPDAAYRNRANQSDKNQYTAEKPQIKEPVGRKGRAAGNAAEQTKPRRIANTGIAPHDLIYAADHKAAHISAKHDRKSMKHGLHMTLGNEHFKPELHAQVNGQCNQHQIKHKHRDLAHPHMIPDPLHCFAPIPAAAGICRIQSHTINIQYIL